MVSMKFAREIFAAGDRVRVHCACSVVWLQCGYVQRKYIAKQKIKGFAVCEIVQRGDWAGALEACLKWSVENEGHKRKPLLTEHGKVYKVKRYFKLEFCISSQERNHFCLTLRIVSMAIKLARVLFSHKTISFLKVNTSRIICLIFPVTF